MKNALIYFYDFYLDELTKINNNYYFSINNNNFVVEEYKRPFEEINEIYKLNIEMLKSGVPVYKIILNKQKSVLFSYEKINYVVMQLPKIKNRIIKFDDIINFNYFPIDKYLLLDKSNWSSYWEQKIDYLEYQELHIEKKYLSIDSSFNYYLGIWENAISYYNNNVNNLNIKKCVVHKRIDSKSDLLVFYNPLNFVIDTKERDVADYLKSYVLNIKFTTEQLNYFFLVIDKKYSNIFRFLTRLLFPNLYFDIYEEIVYYGESEDKLKNFLVNRKNYDYLIKYAFNYYKNIPNIEWIKKED